MATNSSSITNFINAIAKNGGMSMSNGYDVQFDLSNTGVPPILSKLNINVNADNTSAQPGSLINMFCDEAQLPNSQSATGQLNGRYVGEGSINYPHTRMVSDFSLTWMCDANMAPYKFLTAWYNFIFGEFDIGGIDKFIKTPDSLREFKSKSVAVPQNRNRINRLKYPNQYQGVLKISKTERGNNAPNSRVPLVYVIEDCYPYAIDAVPLSYGSSQITKVSANFYYTRHSIYYANITNFKG